MRLGNSEEYVQVSASPEAYEGGVIGTDVFVSVDVQVDMFSAGIAVIIERGDWGAFIERLSRLDKERRGEAVLKSADDRELELRIFAVDSAGHMAVSGKIERSDIASVPRFTFERILFDPTVLPELVAELTAAISHLGGK